MWREWARQARKEYLGLLARARRLRESDGVVPREIADRVMDAYVDMRRLERITRAEETGREGSEHGTH